MDHFIRNMALLSSEDISRLSNSVFEVKRALVLELNRKGSQGVKHLVTTALLDRGSPITVTHRGNRQ